MPKYAELIYNGFWFAPEREMLQAAIDHSQAKVSGTVRLKLYKGSAHVVGRKSPHSLYSERHVTFEDDAGRAEEHTSELQSLMRSSYAVIRLKIKKPKTT